MDTELIYSKMCPWPFSSQFVLLPGSGDYTCAVVFYGAGRLYQAADDTLQARLIKLDANPQESHVGVKVPNEAMGR